MDNNLGKDVGQISNNIGQTNLFLQDKIVVPTDIYKIAETTHKSCLSNKIK